MNCAQCQAANSPDAGFCGNCGARLAPASTAAGASGYPQSSGAPSGDSGPSGYGNSGEPTVLGTPAFHAPPPGAGAPSGYGAPSGSGQPGYGPPSGSGQPGYGPPAGSGGPSGYGGPGYGPDGYGPPPPAAGYGPPPGANYGAPGGQAPNGQAPNGQAPGGYQQGQYQPGPSGGRSSSLPPVSFSLARLTTVDKIIGVATLITMISLWLPWYTVKYSVLGVTSSGSVSGTHDHGWLWLEFLLALALIVYIAARAAWDQLPFQLPVAHEIVLIAATGLQFLLILIAFLAKPSVHGDPGYSIGWGFGAILGLLAAIAAAAPVAYPAVRAYLDRRKSGSGSAGAPRGY